MGPTILAVTLAVILLLAATIYAIVQLFAR
jgi:hypothetical protein